MRVLGLDPGSRRTGWGVVERHGSQFAGIAAGCITPLARAPLPERLLRIAQEVRTLLDAHRPDVVVVEEAFHHVNARSTLVLGQVRGALVLCALERGLALAEYAPRLIKLSVTGRGGATKEQVAFMVNRLLGWTGARPLDASDALAGAICHLLRVRSVEHPQRRGLSGTLALRVPPRRSTPGSERLATLLASGRPRRAGGLR